MKPFSTRRVVRMLKAGQTLKDSRHEAGGAQLEDVLFYRDAEYLEAARMLFVTEYARADVPPDSGKTFPTRFFHLLFIRARAGSYDILLLSKRKTGELQPLELAPPEGKRKSKGGVFSQLQERLLATFGLAPKDLIRVSPLFLADTASVQGTSKKRNEVKEYWVFAVEVDFRTSEKLSSASRPEGSYRWFSPPAFEKRLADVRDPVSDYVRIIVSLVWNKNFGLSPDSPLEQVAKG